MTAVATCSIARSLEVLGEKWTLLVVREAFWGSTRFSEFQSSLGVSTDILTARLATLVDAGVLERRSYREEGARERSSYHLTESGRELRVVLGALASWTNDHHPAGFGAGTVYRDRETHEPVRVGFISATGVPLDAESVEVTRPQ
ncbi:MAG: helix-turn-helix domain-containing protein [Rhodoglobus sp.]